MDSNLTIGQAESVGLSYLKARYLEHRAQQLYSVALSAQHKSDIIQGVLDGTSTLPVDKIRTIPLSGAEYYRAWAIQAWRHYESAQRASDIALLNVERSRAAIKAACNADQAVAL